MFFRRPLIIKAEVWQVDGAGDFGYDGFSCAVIVAIVSFMMIIITFVKLITHVDRFKVWNKFSAIAVDNYRCSTRPGTSNARR